MTKTKKPAALVRCRYCRETHPKADAASWAHIHPAVCEFRQDRVPVLNGVHVGDHWRNLHTLSVVRVMECRLGGCDTYTDREPVVVVATIWAPPQQEPGGQMTLGSDLGEPADLDALEPDGWWSVHPLWSLVEHWDPVTRPGCYPVPFNLDDRGWRSAARRWRGPGHRGAPDRKHAYYHSVIPSDGRYCLDWDVLTRLWQESADG